MFRKVKTPNKVRRLASFDNERIIGMRNAVIILWQSERKLVLAGILCLVVLVAGVGYVFTRQTFLIFTPHPYNPSRVDVPNYIGGYKVLTVFTPDNLACMNPGEIRLVLQAPESNLEKYLANSHPKDIQKDLEQHGLDATIEIVGPGVTIEQIIRESVKWNRDIKKTGCIKLGPAELPQTTKEP